MSKIASYGEINLPLRVGIVGTGFAAKIRAQSFVAEKDERLSTGWSANGLAN